MTRIILEANKSLPLRIHIHLPCTQRLCAFEQGLVACCWGLTYLVVLVINPLKPERPSGSGGMAPMAQMIVTFWEFSCLDRFAASWDPGQRDEGLAWALTRAFKKLLWGDQTTSKQIQIKFADRQTEQKVVSKVLWPCLWNDIKY